jgi:hypothetical protein
VPLRGQEIPRARRGLGDKAVSGAPAGTAVHCKTRQARKEKARLGPQISSRHRPYPACWRKHRLLLRHEAVHSAAARRHLAAWSKPRRRKGTAVDAAFAVLRTRAAGMTFIHAVATHGSSITPRGHLMFSIPPRWGRCVCENSRPGTVRIPVPLPPGLRWVAVVETTIVGTMRTIDKAMTTVHSLR